MAMRAGGGLWPSFFLLLLLAPATAGAQALAPTAVAPAPAAPGYRPVSSPAPLVESVAPAQAPTAVAASTDPLLPMEDPWARPYFVKGDLESFSVRPLTRRNFVGIGTGVSALPSGTNTVLNAYYLTVEPQFDLISRKYAWRLGLGAPLQFELLDTRGLFEECITEGRSAKNLVNSQLAVAAVTGDCLQRRKDRVTQNFGQLRRADWDELSDFMKVIRYAEVGGRERPFYLSISRLYDQSFGHGTVVRHYNPNINFDTARVGAIMDFSVSAVGLQAMANDLVNPDVLGMLAFVRPFRPYSNSVFLRSLSFGATWVHGINQPRRLKYERGLFLAAYDQPIPVLEKGAHHAGVNAVRPSTIGGNVEAKIVRTTVADIKVYADHQQMVRYGGGTSVGTLARFSFGEPARHAIRLRLEGNTFDASYLPSYYDAYHDIFKNQYIPIAYRSSNGMTYHPTKIEYLEASRGGGRRAGGYGELSYSALDRLTLAASARVWTPVGGAAPGFVGPAFPDYGSPCTEGAPGSFACANSVTFDRDPGFASVRFHLELPFRKGLQAFASYELFTTTAEPTLGLFNLDGDNEIFFSGARIMLLPILFLQAEARRYFFVQRIANVDLQALSLEQDQNARARWTFALSAYVGYEF